MRGLPFGGSAPAKTFPQLRRGGERRQVVSEGVEDSENIHFNGPVDMAIAGAPPVGKRLSIEFYMAPQRTHGFPADRPILLGTKEIGPDGRVEMELPAGVPLFEIIRRPDGRIAQGRDGQVFHVGGLNFGQANHEARCVGCHSGHSLLEPGEDLSWTNLASSATVSASSTRSDVPPFFEPKALVDRRTDAIVCEWCAAGPEPRIFLTLRWSVPLRGKALNVYGPAPGEGLLGTRNQTIRAFQVDTYRSWYSQQHLVIKKPISARGTKVDLDPEVEFDAVVLTIEAPDVRGLYEGQPGAALAEVEVIAKPAGAAQPVVYFIRGDSNCDSQVNLSDSVSLLGSLFLGNGRPCCSEAADVNGDALLDLADAVYLLNHLFHSGHEPGQPFPRCGPSPEGSLGCDREACP